MPRNMSFALTTAQFRDQTKTVTRRFGWWFLKPGDQVMGVVKSMGLKKGEAINRLGLIEIVSTRPERLHMISQEDVIKEGFPDWTPSEFIVFLMEKTGVDPLDVVNRIEFRYL